jgi:hypothetical protein
MIVESRAIGRMGPVVDVEGEAVYIRIRNGRLGVTGFNGGDPVRFVFATDDTVYIVNEDIF